MTEENKTQDIYFEYQKPMPDLPNGMKGNQEIKEGFKTFLDEVWKKYKEEMPEKYWQDENIENDEDIERKQPFLYFDSDKFKPKNYIGFIKYKDFSFNIYPKICEDEYKKAKIAYDNETDKDTKKELKEKLVKTKEQINQMLLLWLQYSDNTILPKIETGLDEISDYDFMEFLIFLFAKYTSDLLAVSIYQHYEEISEETSFLKGKLNFNEYIKNCAMGKAHKFHCTYDSFEVNNKFNQIIKYVSKQLLNITDKSDNQNYLNDILFKLDEADDVVCTYSDCEKVYINRFMGEFNTVLDYCKMFLKNAVMFNEIGDIDSFAFLFRTEVLFEDFISNFAGEKITDYNVFSQEESKLDTQGNFHIRPDLLIKTKDDGKPDKIIDIKYKKVNSRKDVSNADIYQCVTYAAKLGCNDVTLLYPKFNDEKELEPAAIKLLNGNNTEITLHFAFIECCPCSGIQKPNKDNDIIISLQNAIQQELDERIKEKD